MTAAAPILIACAMFAAQNPDTLAAIDSASVSGTPAVMDAPASIDTLAGTESAAARVTVPVLIDSIPVYIAVGTDSASAQAAAQAARRGIALLRAQRGHAEAVRLEERNGSGIVLIDSVVVLRIEPENRADPTASPLANALRLRDRVLIRPGLYGRIDELLLRLLLGVAYPVSLLVLLRFTRSGVHQFERHWRRALLDWIHRMAERRGVPEAEIQGRRIVESIAAIGRFAAFGIAFVALSFTWFALFPQTRPLASALLSHAIAPFLTLLGGTARGLLLLVYSALVVVGAVAASRAIAHRRSGRAAALFADPLVRLPVRLGIWVAALLLILFPYPGAPRQFAVGVLLLLLLAAVIGLRPLIEEIATGIYLNSHYELGIGNRILVDESACIIVATGLVHLEVDRDGRIHRLPYSRILKSDFSLPRRRPAGP